MNDISEQELREAVIATKKDAKLVSAAKNDRINSPESLYKEFTKLTVDRQREIINQIANEHFVSAQWKVAFALNNFPAPGLPDAVNAAGKALFFSREEDALKGTIHALKLYSESPFHKTIASSLGDAAEITRLHLARVTAIITHPEMFGLIQSLDPASPLSPKIVQVIVKIASYTRDFESTMSVARFLQARRHSPVADKIASLIEDTIFHARDKKSVREVLAGFGAGSIDRVMERNAENKATVSAIRDVAWKTRDSRAIRSYLESV